MSQDLSGGVFGPIERGKWTFHDDLLRYLSRVWRKSAPLTPGFMLSLILHGSLVAILLLSAPSAGKIRRAPARFDLQPFYRALAELKSAPDLLKPEAISPADEKALANLMIQSPMFDPTFSEREKTDLFKNLISSYVKMKDKEGPTGSLPKFSLDDLLEKSQETRGATTRTGDKIYSRGRLAGEGSPAFVKIDRGIENKLAWLRRFEKEGADHVAFSGDFVIVRGEMGNKYVPEEFYFRECPYEEILARGAGLFYAVEGFPVFGEGGGPESEKSVRLKWTGPADETLQKDLLLFLIKKKTRPAPEKPAAAPPRNVLTLSPDKRRDVLDGLMSMADGAQLSYFIQHYLRTYDLDRGDLPELTREFIYDNLNSVFLVPDSFSAAYDFLEELFYSKNIQGGLVSFARDEPRTKTAAEVLFSLAAFINFEKRTISYLLDAHETAKKIVDGQEIRWTVYSPKAKALVIKRVAEDLIAELQKMGISSEQEIRRLYNRQEAGIYNGLISRGGEERNRALYALGCLFWEEKDHLSAIKTWRQIDLSFALGIYQPVKRELAVYEMLPLPIERYLDRLIPKIDNVLQRDYGDSSEKHLKRLIKFHKWKNRTTGTAGGAPGQR